MKIRLCENNKGASKVYKQLRKEFPEANIKVKGCIKKCALCHEVLFALVDGKPIYAIEIEELMSKIRPMIQD
jgi:uncharacterized protein YuzB (UPF0349 family)